jgi:HEAT repeat protein
MGWLRDLLTRTPRYPGKNCWQWAREIGSSRPGGECETAFSTMGPRAAQALIDSFSSANPREENARAAQILAKMGPAVVPYAVRALVRSSFPATREWCGQTLQQIGAAALDALVQAMGGDVQQPRSAVTALLGALDMANAPPRSTIIWALCQMGPPGVPALVEALVNAQTQVRLTALEALGQMREIEVPSSGLVKLAAALDDKNGAVRRAAVQALGQVSGAQATAALLRALEHRDQEVVLEAVRALGRRVTAETAPALVRVVAGSNNAPALEAARALCQVSVSQQGVAETVIELLLEESEAAIRLATALREMTERAWVIPTLLRCFDKLGRAPDGQQIGRVVCLCKDDPNHLAMLLDASAQTNSRRRDWIGQILERAAATGVSAFLLIWIDLLQHKNQDWRLHAVHALDRLGPAARGAAPALLRVVQGMSPERLGVTRAALWVTSLCPNGLRQSPVAEMAPGR